MKHARYLILALPAILCLMANSNAQSPPEQLQQLVAQLQEAPTDDALREKIIKLAVTMKPAPAVPDEAIRFEGRAQYAFNSAKSEADYLVAAQEYEKAIAVAPWVTGYYADLCTIYDKAGKLDEAKRNCSFYLIGLSDPDQITETKRRIAGLEFAIEKFATARAEAEKIARAARAKAEAEDEETLIVPGERVGRIRIGMPCSQVEQVLGKAEGNYKLADGTPEYYWTTFTIQCDERMNVRVVWIRSSKYKTKAGVAVGSPYDEARREWGVPSQVNEKGNVRVQSFAVRNTVTVGSDVATGRITFIIVF